MKIWTPVLVSCLLGIGLSGSTVAANPAKTKAASKTIAEHTKLAVDPMAITPLSPNVVRAMSASNKRENAERSKVSTIEDNGNDKAGTSKHESDADAPFKHDHYVLGASLPVNGYHKGQPSVVIVDKGSHSTHVLQLQNHKIVRVLTISNAIGTGETPTPPGPYRIRMKKMYPEWIPTKSIDPKQKPVPPYNETHKNPLGVAAIYLNKFDIDLHGTNQPDLIRKSVSHGCVRHSNGDILKLYNMVHTGDVVYIVNQFRGKVLLKSDFVHKVH